MPLQAIRDYVKQSGGTVSAEIVDLDVPVEDRTPAAQAVTSLGIRMDGHPLFGGNVSELRFRRISWHGCSKARPPECRGCKKPRQKNLPFGRGGEQ